MKVTVHFVGVCTQLNDLPHSTRVVLVNAGFGANIAGYSIPPHRATLYIPIQFIAGALPTLDGLTPLPSDSSMTWAMTGVRLQLSNTASGLTKLPDYLDLPSLTQLAQAANPNTSLEINQRVVSAGAAACDFQITAGVLDAYREPHTAAAIGKLTIQTDAPPQLIVTRIWDGSVATIPLQSAGDVEPVIFVSNIGIDADTVADFMLHYGVTTFTPDRLLVPVTSAIRAANAEERATLAMFPVIPDGMTIGCSNSNYP